jgi:hypothetical protein
VSKKEELREMQKNFNNQQVKEKTNFKTEKMGKIFREEVKGKNQSRVSRKTEKECSQPEKKDSIK